MHISNFQNYSDIKRSNISILLGYGLMNFILVICYSARSSKRQPYHFLLYYFLYFSVTSFSCNRCRIQTQPGIWKDQDHVANRLWYFLLFYHFYNIFTGSICLFSAYSSIVNLLWQSPIECTLYVSNISC